MAAPTQGSRPRPQGPNLGDLSGAGMQFAIVLAVFLLGGMWLDRKLGTAPWLMITGVVIGGGGGFWSMYRQLVIAPRERQGPTDKGET